MHGNILLLLYRLWTPIAEKDKAYFEDKLSATVTLNQNIKPASLKLESSEQTIRTCEKELMDLGREKRNLEAVLVNEHNKAACLVEDKEERAASRLVLEKDLLLKFSELEASSKDLMDGLKTDIVKKQEESDLLLKEVEKNEENVHLLQERIKELENALVEKDQLLVELETREKQIDNQKAVMSSLSDTESKPQEAKKEYEHMLESKHSALSKHLKEIHQGRRITRPIASGFRNLSDDLIMNICCKLPLKELLGCTIICQSWYDMIKSSEFARDHLRFNEDTNAYLATYNELRWVSNFSIWRINDDATREENGSYVQFLFNFSFAYNQAIHSSVDGLLFLCRRNLCIINPLLPYQYIELPEPLNCCPGDVFGFGVSRRGDYKVVKISSWKDRSVSNCEVYTLGSDLWRRTARGTSFNLSPLPAVFFGGKLYWMTFEYLDDLSAHIKIVIFDLEMEEFVASFSLADQHLELRENSYLSVFKDSVCLSDTDAQNAENMERRMFVWGLREYEDATSCIEELLLSIGYPQIPQFLYIFL